MSTIPDFMMSKADQPASYEPKRGPFDFDMKSVWQRDAEDKEDKEKREENGVHVEGSPGSTKEEQNHWCCLSLKRRPQYQQFQIPTVGSKMESQWIPGHPVLLELLKHNPMHIYSEIKLPATTPRYPHRTQQPTATEPENEPVNFSKLISSGYGDEWLQQRDEWDKKNSQPNDSETFQPESTQTDNADGPQNYHKFCCYFKIPLNAEKFNTS